MAKRAPVTLSDRLRAARIKLGKTQLEIAMAAGVRPEVVNRLENGRSGASLASLHRLAPVLGLSLDELAADLNLSKPKPPKPTRPPSPAKKTAKKGIAS